MISNNVISPLISSSEKLLQKMKIDLLSFLRNRLLLCATVSGGVLFLSSATFYSGGMPALAAPNHIGSETKNVSSDQNAGGKAASNPARGAAAKLKGNGPWRELTFPADVSVGRLVILDDNFALTNRHVGGRPFGEARGTVRVPVGKPVMLIAADTLTDRASCLDVLPADALTAIVLDRTTMGDEQIAHLKHLTGLKYADFHGTDLSDKGLVNLSGLVNLGYLDISHTMLHGLTLDCLRRFDKLQFLDIGFNTLDRRAFADLGKLHAPHLTFLHISAAGISDGDLGCLAAFPEISQLEMTDNKGISDRGMPALRVCKKLFVLDVRRTAVTLKGIFVLKGLPLYSLTMTVVAPLIEDEKKLRALIPGINICYDHPPKNAPKELFAPLH
jgi:Leucine-rich repeat (LRR) protein